MGLYLLEELDSMDLSHIGADPLLLLLFSVCGYFIRNRFMNIDSQISKIKSDAEILEVVNSKYVSRREFELVTTQLDNLIERTKNHE